MMLTTTEKITLRHRERRAYVYVRQSTPKQVHQHREGQENQYALVERAVGLGWHPERVHIIDADLGQSGQNGQRAGFQELVSEVSLGHVGLILTYEASRLARNNADWYGLLDLAALVGVLIADTDGVYDPRGYNDRMLLGLRGMLSEAELHLLQLRMAAGRMRQVEKGTYRQRLPTGLVRLEHGRVSRTRTSRYSTRSGSCSPVSPRWVAASGCCGACAMTASCCLAGNRRDPRQASSCGSRPPRAPYTRSCATRRTRGCSCMGVTRLTRIGCPDRGNE